MPNLEALLERQRSALHALVEREASGVLRFEAPEDLVQGIMIRALGSRFEYRDEIQAQAWLRVLARRHIADRHAHWSALRRGSGKVLRLTWSDASTNAVRAPADSLSGPASFAERRELIELATKALHTLPERDRNLVRWMSQGVDLQEQAERLNLPYGACQRAGHRAIERFRIAFEVLTRAAREP